MNSRLDRITDWEDPVRIEGHQVDDAKHRAGGAPQPLLFSLAACDRLERPVPAASSLAVLPVPLVVYERLGSNHCNQGGCRENMEGLVSRLRAGA